MSKPIRVLVVDDHAIVREGICALLARRKDIQVIGEAADGKRAIDAVAQFDPDVVLMDIQMPVLDGLEATREIHKRFPAMRILVLTQHDSKEYVVPLLRAGAVGYITKSARATELIGAIRAVYEEGAYLPPRITQTVVSAISESSDAQEERPLLTEREVEVLRLVAEGLSSREIAERLNISVKTVDTHRANIMEKLGVHNSAELIKLAIRKGIVSA
ncbi:MAG: response regulator transcription factor [Anaerolineales bacterium]|nr:response regulator transcription factor [Anaerolineales bacterium]